MLNSASTIFLIFTIISTGLSKELFISNTAKADDCTTRDTTEITICENELPYNWNDFTIESVGTYNDTLISAAGCDSIVILNLFIDDLTIMDYYENAEESYVWDITGETYYNSGLYTDTTTNANGCQHIDRLHLTIYSSEAISKCESYTWPVNGVTYTQTGVYTATDPATGNTVTLDLVIYPNPKITLDAINNVSCYGNDDASIEISVSGGTNPYSYKWRKNGELIASTRDISGLTAGTYVFIVTDSKGCESPPEIIAINQPDDFFVEVEKQDVDCYGSATGSAKVMVLTGGKPSYTYAWSGPNGFTSTGNEISGLIPGTYKLTVTDANGCVTEKNIAITEPPELLAYVDDQVLCEGDSVQLTGTASGGTGSYTHAWTGEGAIYLDNESTATVQFSGAPEGTYELIYSVTDILGCSAADSAIVIKQLTNQPDFTPIGPICQNSIPPALPSTDINGVTGTWSPATISTDAVGIFEYTFTPNESYGCYEPSTIFVEIIPLIIPEIAPIGPLYYGDIPPSLPSTDLNGIVGTWYPSLIATDSVEIFEYTFTPDAGYMCSIPVTITIEILPGEVPEINCPPATTIECTDPPFYSISDFIDAGGSYISYWSADSLLLLSDSISEQSCPKTILRNYQIINVNGDSSNVCTHLLNVDDKINPNINCPPNLTVNTNDDIPPRYSIDDFIDAGGKISDNCAIDTTSFGLMSEFMDTLLTPDILKRTYYIADKCVNYDICLHQITIQNATANDELFDNKLEFTIYPNPSQGIITFNLIGLRDKEFLLFITDANGKEVYRKKIIADVNNGQIDLSDKAKGIYNVVVYEGETKLVKSIVIH